MKREQWRHIVTTRIEHHAVLRACGHLEKGNFRRDVLEAEQPTLLAVMVSDCVWCREPEPVLAELAADGANV